MALLYNRVASANIGNRLFTFPPFDIEFDQTLKINKVTSTNLKLYNPAPDTIKACEKKGRGAGTTYPIAIVEAGYEEESGTCVIGEIFDYKVNRKGVDNILELKISDKTLQWQNAIINTTYRKMAAINILNGILAQVGIVGNIQSLGVNKFYETFTATTFKSAITKIVKDTNSEFFFKNGTITIQPKTFASKRVLLLTPQTGLVETPQKTQRGYKFKTLFFFQLNVGDYVKLQTNSIDAILKITNGKKKFSTFGKAGCEWEGIQ